MFLPDIVMKILIWTNSSLEDHKFWLGGFLLIFPLSFIFKRFKFCRLFPTKSRGYVVGRLFLLFRLLRMLTIQGFVFEHLVDLDNTFFARLKALRFGPKTSPGSAFDWRVHLRRKAFLILLHRLFSRENSLCVWLVRLLLTDLYLRSGLSFIFWLRRLFGWNLNRR